MIKELYGVIGNGLVGGGIRTLLAFWNEAGIEIVDLRTGAKVLSKYYPKEKVAEFFKEAPEVNKVILCTSKSRGKFPSTELILNDIMKNKNAVKGICDLEIKFYGRRKPSKKGKLLHPAGKFVFRKVDAGQFLSEVKILAQAIK